MIIRILTTLTLLLALNATTIAQPNLKAEQLIPELATQLNLWRLEQGREVLVFNETLESMAAQQADYLMTQDFITDFHQDRNGQYPRQRSQNAAFDWPTFGHPRFIEVAEIAALGNSVDFALNYWKSSELHRSSSLNPDYREVGIAIRERGDLLLFIVVLGSRPDALPALADPDVGDLYLTNERTEYTPDGWIGEVSRFRILDADEMPVEDWQDWTHRVQLPQLDSDFFYVQYEDANRQRTTARVTYNPRWSAHFDQISTPNEAEVEQVDTVDAVESEATYVDDTTSSEVVIDTNATEPEDPTKAEPDTSDNASDDGEGQDDEETTDNTPLFDTRTVETQPVVRLVYSDAYFTLVNLSGDVADVYDLQFRNGENTYSAFAWETVMADLNLAALPDGHCLQLGGVNISASIAPLDECRWIRSFITISETRFFWTHGAFDVLYRGEMVARCPSSALACDVILG